MSSPEETLSVLGETNIHLDFHTPGFQREIGSQFDPERFGRRLDEADVDSIALFGKGCHGFSYYDTDVGTRHPELEFDLLEAQIEACRERDIDVLVYYTLTWDNLPGQSNPDWYQRDGDGEALDVSDPDDRFEWLCLNSPYGEELVLPQVEELLEYDIDGVFFDILVYHRDACTCRYCRRDMRDQGLDPGNPDDRRRHRSRVAETFAERTTRLIRSVDEEQVVVYNHRLNLGLTTDLADHMDYVLIESLPAGWGYMHTPMMARYARNLDLPVHGMTGIFHKVWGDFGTVKHGLQLQYELANSLSHHLPVSVGDQLRPRGELESAKYDTIGDAFRFVKDRNLPMDADPLRDVAVVFPGTSDIAGRSIFESESKEMEPDGAIGATKLLCDTHQQFDILDEQLARDLLGSEGFETVILPDTGPLDPRTVDAVRAFVDDGGTLLATGASSLGGDGTLALGGVFGVRRQGRLPYSTAYFTAGAYDDGLPDLECVSYGPFQSIVAEEATPTGWVVAPTSERSETRRFSHFQAPPERELDVPAISHNEYGDGEAVYVGTNLFTQYFAEDYHAHRRLLSNLLTSLQSERALTADAPPSLEVNAMVADDGTYVHLTNYSAFRAGGTLPQVEQTRPLRDIGVTVRTDGDRVSALTDCTVELAGAGDGVTLAFDEVGLYEVVKVE